MSTTKKVALITGGARGLGREIAAAFYASGYRVVINYIRSDESAAALKNEIAGDALLLKADVGSYPEVFLMSEIVRSTWGRLDVLVNNAGITKDAVLARQKQDDWDRIIGTNLKGAFNTVRAFAGLMTDGGHVINISSYSGLKGKEGQAAYSASKAALLGFTKTAAIELAESNIRVNAVLPGYMPTDMGLAAESAARSAREESLLGVLSDPREVAGFIVYLAGTENITGQIFCLDSRIV